MTFAIRRLAWTGGRPSSARGLLARLRRFALVGLHLGLCLTCGLIEAATTTYEYDALGRLTALRIGADQRIDYQYDSAGNLIGETINQAAGFVIGATAAPAAGGAVVVSPTRLGYRAGEPVTLVASPAAGFVFSGWQGHPSCNASNVCSLTMPAGNLNLVANFAAPTAGVPLVVKALPEGTGVVSPTIPATGLSAGAAVTLTATPAAGYQFDGWYGAACGGASSSNCSFIMPSSASTVFARFKPVSAGGSGFQIGAFNEFIAPASGDPSRGGVIEVLPRQDALPANAPVSVRVHPALGFRLVDMVVRFNGTVNSAICPDANQWSIRPGASASCSFVMPAGNVSITGRFTVDSVRFPLSVASLPVEGGAVDLRTQPNGNFEVIPDDSTVPVRKLVAAGVNVTLTAKSMGARQFLRWLNGPCVNSTNPVCSFTMPAAQAAANAAFGEEPLEGCSYAVRAPSLVFPVDGGSRSITVDTQPGCSFNVGLSTSGMSTPSQPMSQVVTGNVIHLTVPQEPTLNTRSGFLRVHTGREVFLFPVAQGGQAGRPPSVIPTTQVSLPALEFGSVGAGDPPTSPVRVVITNTSGQVQSTVGHSGASPPQTAGQFSISGTDCPPSLAAGASCQFDVQLVPRRPGPALGELQVIGTTMTWQADLRGTVLPSRENVAAARSGGSIAWSIDQSEFSATEQSLIDGDRRGAFAGDQGFWYARTSSPKTFELTFASTRAVDRVFLFGRGTESSLAQTGTLQEPTTTTIPNDPGVFDFSVEYWTGGEWAPVNLLSKTGMPYRWQRAEFVPVSTSKMRIVAVPSPTLTYLNLAEIEVWTVPSDAVPDSFTFTSQFGVGTSTVVSSNSITPAGLNVAAPIAVANGAYSIGCNGNFSTSAGTISPGQSVCLRHTSAGVAAGVVTTTLTIGGVRATFSSVVADPNLQFPDSFPDAITPQAVSGVRPGTDVVFALVTVTGINTAVPISVSNGEFSLGCTTEFTAAPSVVTNGQTVCVRHIASPTIGSTVTTTLTVGEQAIAFSSTAASLSDSQPGPGTVTQVLTVVPGWNLLGNGVNVSIAASALGNASEVLSVWKWLNASAKWAFYSPLLSAAELATYAQAKGYEVLSAIAPNEGFWINAVQPATLHSVSATPVAAPIDSLSTGWNLLGTGVVQTPTQFNAGSARQPGVVSLWAWEPVQRKWLFFAPSLANQGGSALQSYIDGQGYLDFVLTGRNLGPGVGFWVNRPAP